MLESATPTAIRNRSNTSKKPDSLFVLIKKANVFGQCSVTCNAPHAAVTPCMHTTLCSCIDFAARLCRSALACMHTCAYARVHAHSVVPGTVSEGLNGWSEALMAGLAV